MRCNSNALSRSTFICVSLLWQVVFDFSNHTQENCISWFEQNVLEHLHSKREAILQIVEAIKERQKLKQEYDYYYEKVRLVSVAVIVPTVIGELFGFDALFTAGWAERGCTQLTLRELMHSLINHFTFRSANFVRKRATVPRRRRKLTAMSQSLRRRR